MRKLRAEQRLTVSDDEITLLTHAATATTDERA
jgi:hypothetical protein